MSVQLPVSVGALHVVDSAFYSSPTLQQTHKDGTECKMDIIAPSLTLAVSADQDHFSGDSQTESAQSAGHAPSTGR